MRLQLTVQRHSLPPAQVLWTAGVLRPPYAAAGASCTISQFLEQVNDVIPLESEDWGLEDYAVEVRGFECLHFAELEQVLKEDDEVCIRPLQTFDLRFRKVSGRHQISADGKHLIDGVAFGRPFIRRADRPAVRIPPRKRRRITYDEEDEDAEAGINDRQLMVRPDFGDVNGSDEYSDDEDDEDFSAMDGESLLGELEDLQKDLQDDVLEDLEEGERALNLDGAEEAVGKNMRSRRRRKTGLGLQGSALVELLDDNGRPYPGEYSNPLLDLYDKDEPVDGALNESLPKVRKSKRLRDTVRNGEIHTKSPKTSPESASGPASSGSTKGVRFSDAETMTPATVRLDENVEVFDAESFKPLNSTESPLDGSDKENAEPNDEESDLDESPFVKSGRSSVMSTSSDSDSEDSSSSDSSSSSGSDSEDENSPSSAEKESARPSFSSSDSDSSESEPEKLPSKTAITNLKIGADSKAPESRMTAPGQGKHQTRMRNRRRRASKKRALLVKAGLVPPNSLADLHGGDAGHQEAVPEKPEKAINEPTEEVVNSATAFEAKRKALLASISTGGVDVNADLDGENEAPVATEKANEDRVSKVPMEDSSMTGTQVDVQNSQQLPIDEVSLEKEATKGQITGTPEAAAIAVDSISPNSSKRRAKLDMASSRRLLFGSLGLRAPKTKEDESNLRDKLKRDVRPVKVTQSSEEFVADSIGEDQSWKDKVVLSAVECCQKGVQLSTPPFPFVQRWDPQQQTGYGRRGGRGKTNNKKRKRKSKQYYENWEDQDAEHDVLQQQESNYYGDEQESGERSVKPKSKAQSQRTFSDEGCETAVNDQLMREAEGISASVPIGAEEMEDLPDLPEDMSLCPDLSQEICIPGAVVAFKQLDMSAETNWQPRVSEYKTAIIDQATDRGTLQMILAKRDQPTKEELYDEETGERIYGKFEMPGYEEDEGDDGNGNGIVEISLADLIHPKLIRAAKPQPNKARLQQSAEDASPAQVDYTVMPEETGDLYPSLEKSNFNKTDEPMHDSTAEEANEQARKEIRDLISDAGWRSSIGSEVLKHATHPEPKSSESAQFNDHGNVATTISSPRFAGFSSSPPPNRLVPSHDELPPDTTGLETDESMLPQTVAETTAATSPRSEHLTSYKADEDLGPGDNVENDVVWDDIPSKPASPEGNRESVPKRLSPPQSSSKLVSQSSYGLFSHKSNVSFDGADSEDEFPTLENVLASTRSSFESLVPEDEDSTFAAKSSFESIPSADEDQKRQRRSKSAAKRSIRAQSKCLPEFRTFKKDEDKGFTPRLSQIPPETQIVDLTQSSDPVYASRTDEDENSYRLPSGPGWVKKTKTGSKQPNGQSLRSRTRSSA